MQEKRKQIICFAVNLDIEELHAYAGYKGDLIIKITTKHKEVLAKIRKYALSLEIVDVVMKQNVGLALYEIYCVTEDDDIYHIQAEDLLEDIRDNHPDIDEWGDRPL